MEAAVETTTPASQEPAPAAATTASTASTAKINKCVQDLQFLASTDMEPLEQFNKFVDEVCLGLDLRVPSKYSSIALLLLESTNVVS